MGVVFEMPLLSWLLSKLGILNRSFFNKYRRHAIVGLLVAAAFITPSSDPFTLACVFFPLYGLYELSAFFVKKAPEDKEIETTELVKT
jgi:sec-independent protein translocase protein TatC